jgi:rare lipoprotein A
MPMRIIQYSHSLIVLFCTILFLTSCSRKITENGKASYYADKFEGRRTASGETFHQNRLTAAHRTLPFGTKVKVTNVANGRSVKVRITDRGPFAEGRVIDLSKKAAKRIGMVNTGVAVVEVTYKKKKQ